jgi:hypothetical protein
MGVGERFTGRAIDRGSRRIKPGNRAGVSVNSGRVHMIIEQPVTGTPRPIRAPGSRRLEADIDPHGKDTDQPAVSSASEPTSGQCRCNRLRGPGVTFLLCAPGDISILRRHFRRPLIRAACWTQEPVAAIPPDEHPRGQHRRHPSTMLRRRRGRS